VSVSLDASGIAVLAVRDTGAGIEPEMLEHQRANGAVIVDIRPLEQRTRDGALPGAIVIDRNLLEWRLDPACEHHIADVAGYDTRIVIVCNEGYSSSLAAALLHDLGLHQATDLVGGFHLLLTERRSRSGGQEQNHHDPQ
jgi:rhodanese-related sulfurtransferase